MKDYISTAEPSAAQLAAFKKYARITGTADDEGLADMLKAAMIEVQDFADKTILPGVVRVTDDRADGSVRLFETVDKILSVTSDGMVATDYQLNGNTLTVAGSVVSVTYATKVHAGNAARLMRIAFRYAAALEEGDTDAVLSKILATC